MVNVMVSDHPNSVLIGDERRIIGKSYQSYEDAATVALLMRDWYEENNIDVNLIYNW